MWHFVIKIFTFFSPLLPYLPYRILFNFSFLNHDNVEASNTAIRFSKFKENFIPPVRCTRKVSTFNEELWFYGKKHQKIGKSQKPLKCIVLSLCYAIWGYSYLLQIDAGKCLDVPLICTEQYPEKLGNIVKELDIKHAKGVYAKSLFSMAIPEVNSKITELFGSNLESVVIFGIEVWNSNKICVYLLYTYDFPLVYSIGSYMCWTNCNGFSCSGFRCAYRCWLFAVTFRWRQVFI